jgi:hypothetical protein
VDKKRLIIWTGILVLIFIFFYVNRSNVCIHGDRNDPITNQFVEASYSCEILYIPMIITMIIFSTLYFGFFYFIKKKK